MTGDHVPQPNGSRAPRPRRAAARAEPGDLLRGLEKLREALRERLDALERLARERPELQAEPRDRLNGDDFDDVGGDEAPEGSPRERDLMQTIRELEERQARLVADARRREHEWLTAMEQVENDRQLLAEAWERALRCDPVSAYGGIVAVNRTLDAAAAERIAAIFTEVIIAPDAEPEARAVLARKKKQQEAERRAVRQREEAQEHRQRAEQTQLEADRQAGVLRVLGSYGDPDGAQALAAELRRLADWQGLADVVVEPRGDLAPVLTRELAGSP